MKQILPPLVPGAAKSFRKPSLMRDKRPFSLLSGAFLAGIFLLACASANAQLPAGWSDADIGSPGIAGSASYSSGTWTVSGGGADIWNSADQFHFAYSSTTNNAIVARVLTQDDTDPWAKAGVMFRDSVDASSVYVDVVATPGNGISLQWRDTSGGQCGYSQGPSLTVPIWVKLVNSGGVFTAFYSLDGSNWTQVGSPVAVSMSATPLAGLCVTAHNDSALNTSTFSNVALSDYTPPPPPVFGIYRQMWTGLPAIGNSLDTLTNTANNPNWPDNPNSTLTMVFTNFETEINSGRNNYGQRLRTFVIPPSTGDYIFWIASDDSSALYLSTNENPANMTQIANVNSWTGSREWGKEANQQSVPIHLQAGSRYYLEARMQQGGGGDNLALRWQLPDGSTEEPMTAASATGTRMIPFTGLDSAPGIFQQTTNLAVVEGQSAVFSVLVTNQAPVTYRWSLDGNPLPGASATQSSYAVTNASIALNNGHVYRCAISNSVSVTFSAPMTLTVTRDLVPPAVVRALNLGTSAVQVVFSKPVEAASATNTGNYLITNGLPVFSASLAPDNETVTLATGPMVFGTEYGLRINSVRDRASTPNTIATNTLVRFVATPFASQDIGNPPVASFTSYTSNGLTVTALGSGIGDSADQFNFEFQTRTGDFDVRVRLNGLSPSDVFAKGGLMARESLTSGSRFAASFATPAMNGCFFESRDPANSPSASTGNFPANFPETWLRLKRSGNTFTGFAGYDGQTWTLLGSASITMSNQLYLGFAISSHNTNQPTTAGFLDMSDVGTNAVVAAQVNPHESIGPSSRKTGIVISEIMYKPAPRDDSNDLEFVEIYNSNPWFHDISGYRIQCDDMSYTFPAHTVIPGGAYFVIAASPQSLRNVYGLTNNVFGPYTGSLKKSESLELLDEQGAILLTVPYSSDPPWPIAAHGAGHSLVLANPTYGEEDPRAWDISDVVGGSPGQMEAFRPSPLRNVVINEFLAHTDPPDYDYIELYNHSTNAVDISGCILTDDPDTNKFVIPPGTIIPARGFVSYSETNMNFALNATGESIYFKNPDQSRVLDAVEFGPQQNGIATGRRPDGANDFYRLSAKTPGAPNALILLNDIVINELMYDPISGDDDDQYIELYNKGTNSINLAGWKFTSGVSFTFPNITISAGGYLVVARNLNHLLSMYPNLNSANSVGDYSGKLAHSGEYLGLTMPIEHKTTDTLGNPVTNIINVVVADLTYGAGGRWGKWSHGGGSSLELTDPRANPRLAANWADSDETAKSSWTNIEFTGVLDNGSDYEPAIQHAQIGPLDEGECLVDDVEVDYNGVNYVANPDFESGTNGWDFQGCMVRSTVENGGYNGSGHALHIRCSSRIWTGANSCQMQLNPNSLSSGKTATLRFKARWLRGWPEALLRLNGNWLEATGQLPVPTNLGTPGMPNSRYAPNAGPAIYDVTHTPALPAANEPAVVTARVQDPDGIQSFTLHYRIDPGTTDNPIPMRDDGLGGDAVAGDGIFSAIIPGQGAGRIAAFYLAAADVNAAATRFPALLNDNSPVRECLVMFGDSNPGGSFGVYHLWISQANVNRWAYLPDLSNEQMDCTFVSGSRVIYNMQGRFAGSPYHQNFDRPDGNPCNYKWEFPDDDQFLGATDFNKLHQPGNGPGEDNSLQREQTAYTFLRALGVPWLYRRYAVVYVNGNRRGPLVEDEQVPTGDVVKEQFPDDSNGYLYKMQPWFEFAPYPTNTYLDFNMKEWCTLNSYTTTGGAKKAARYRYNYEIRQSPDSANDFRPVYALVDAANSYGSPDYVANMENLADMENWMRVFAANHAAANRDSFGATTEQNVYGYIGTKGTKYTLIMFDLGICLDHGAWSPGGNLFDVNSDDPYMADIYKNPMFRRMYWRAMQELVNGPLDLANTAPLCNAKFQVFKENGLNVEDPNSSMLPWIAAARTSIAAQVAAQNASGFSAAANIVVSNNVAFLTGQAPFNVDTITVNGINYPLTWTSITNWTILVPLQTGTNPFHLVGVDRNGQTIAGDATDVSVPFAGANGSPVGQIAINEIMYDPPVPGAEFIELHNTSTNRAFDLSQWQIPALASTFPDGSLILPGQFLVLAANRAAFAEAYGATNPVFGTFSGTLLPPQLLSLVQPGTNASSDTTVTAVKYDSAAPWPTNIAGANASLQLVDPHQDNWRVGNWAMVSNGAAAPQWTYFTVTGKASSSTLYMYLQSAGDVYLDDIKLVAGSVPEAGADVLADGDFESGFPGPWTVSANLAGSVLSSAIRHSGSASLHLISTSAGTTQSSAIWQTVSPGLTPNGTYTLSFWYRQSTNGGPLTLRLSGSGIVATVNTAAPPAPSLLPATPGEANSVAETLTPFPPLWINEVQPVNLTGITNKAGQRASWVELYNPGTNVVSLNGLYLANQYNKLLQWAFPASASIAPGEFKIIFADGLTNLSSDGELHTSFALTNGTGSLALTRLDNGEPQVLDYVDFHNILRDDSYGSMPDGQSFVRQEFYRGSPGAPNDLLNAPPPSFVNYPSAGWIYTQDFDSLPNPGAASVNTDNPVTINGVTYSLRNPYDFAGPIVSSGSSGGLGLQAMAGWYGASEALSRFGATDGDQTTGGQVSFGLPGSSNRGLGLLATSSTGGTAFGVRFVNGTGVTLNRISVQVTGEIWRQSNLPKTLQCFYAIDLGNSGTFPNSGTNLPALNVNFPTAPGDIGGAAVDGTSPANQASLILQNQNIAPWPPGADLWLVWTMADSTGKSQGLAVDDLSFSAEGAQSVQVEPRASGGNLYLTWPSTAGVNYQLEYKDDLAAPTWTPVGNPIPGTGSILTSTNAISAWPHRFFRLQVAD